MNFEYRYSFERTIFPKFVLDPQFRLDKLVLLNIILLCRKFLTKSPLCGRFVLLLIKSLIYYV